ncbi:hypothetical protein TNCV_4525521 [Trichonephila clavipes]|nr:hypothetical protein TNCV_4525521 [Trichonephila clavipes]
MQPIVDNCSLSCMVNDCYVWRHLVNWQRLKGSFVEINSQIPIFQLLDQQTRNLTNAFLLLSFNLLSGRSGFAEIDFPEDRVTGEGGGTSRGRRTPFAREGLNRAHLQLKMERTVFFLLAIPLNPRKSIFTGTFPGLASTPSERTPLYH